MVDAYSRDEYRADLAIVRVPCRVRHGDKDIEPSTLERCGRPTAAGIKGSEFRMYEGAPRGLLLSHRTRLNADVVQFVRGG